MKQEIQNKKSGSRMQRAFDRSIFLISCSLFDISIKFIDR